MSGMGTLTKEREDSDKRVESPKGNKSWKAVWRQNYETKFDSTTLECKAYVAEHWSIQLKTENISNLYL